MFKIKSLVFATLMLFSFLVKAEKLPAQKIKRVGPPPLLFTMTLQGNFIANQNLEPEFLVPIPFVFYSKKGAFFEPLRLTVISGGIFNLIAADWSLDEDWTIGIRGQSFLFFAADAPFIDGDNLNDDFTFRGHRFGGGLVVNRRIWVQQKFPLTFRASLDSNYRHFFSDPQTPGYTIPQDFWTIEPELFFGAELPPISELRLYGYFPALTLSYEKRFDYKAWGQSGNQNTNDQFFKGELAINIYHKLSERLTLIEQANLAMITNADRINSLSRGRLNFILAFNQMSLSQVNADRAFTNEGGLRWHLNSQKSLAFKTSFFTGIYRELLIAGERNQFAYGPKVKFMGDLFKRRFNYFVEYGALNGVDENKWLHQIGYGLTYRFKP